MKELYLHGHLTSNTSTRHHTVGCDDGLIWPNFDVLNGHSQSMSHTLRNLNNDQNIFLRIANILGESLENMEQSNYT